MQYLTVTAALLYNALLASAAPTSSSPFERRACSVTYPASIGFPINFDIHQDEGGANKVTNFAKFTSIPEGSYGCQMEVNFPAGYPIISEGNTQVNIYSTSGENNGKLFGPVTFASSPVAATKFVVNSAKCENLMSYRLEIASDTQAGRVAFADTKDAGLSMTYNC